MSDIVKSKRKKSDLQALSNALAIRKRITQELLLLFGYSQKKLDAHIKGIVKDVAGPEEYEAMTKEIRDVYETFGIWLIQRERERIEEFSAAIVEHLVAADTIFPQYMDEFTERRVEWDRALEACNKLRCELQYIAETLPADKNKYMKIVLEIEKEYRAIKALRQSDNRFLEKLKDYVPSKEDAAQKGQAGSKRSGKDLG